MLHHVPASRADTAHICTRCYTHASHNVQLASRPRRPAQLTWTAATPSDCSQPSSSIIMLSRCIGRECSTYEHNATVKHTSKPNSECPLPSAQGTASKHSPAGVSRRQGLLRLSSAVLSLSALSIASGALLQPVLPAAALPLAPLGRVETGGTKRTGLPVEDVKDILANDLAVGQYFVTGDLTKEIFDDNCRFADPTNDVSGLSRYITALGLLFDPANSSVQLKGIEVTGPRTIEADFVLGGTLKFPWHPVIQPVAGHMIYTLNDDGLVQSQVQTWSISPLSALVQSFTPGPSPKS